PMIRRPFNREATWLCFRRSVEADSMTFADLHEIVTHGPFVRFRLFLTDGSSFEIRQPELFMLGRRSVVVGIARSPDQTFYDRSTTVDLLHIMRTEPLEAAASTDGTPS